MRFLEFRCPNRPDKDSDRPCHGQLGGLSVETVEKHDYEKGPIRDVRYCPKCGAFGILTVNGLKKPVAYRIIDTRIDFVKADEYFDFVNVAGRKLR